MEDIDIKWTHLKYLIVDDVHNTRKSIRNILHLLEITKVVEVEDGGSALNILKGKDIDLIICDWNMPGLSGVELLDVLKHLPEHRKIPFLMITGEMSPEKIAQAGEAEVDGFLLKPITAKALEEKIIEILKKKLVPTEEIIAIEKAHILIDAKKFDQAIQFLTNALETRTNSARIMYMIGEVFEAKAIDSSVESDEKIQLLAQAERWYYHAIKTNPQYVKVHNALGKHYDKIGNKEKALASFEAASDLSPFNPARMMKIGEICLETGNVDRADNAFKALSKIQGAKKNDALKEMGELYLRHGFSDKAAEVYEESLKENQDPIIYNKLGIALRKVNKPLEAIKQYLKALSLSPDDEVLYYNIGKAYLEAGNVDQAKVAFKNAVSLDKDFSEAQEEYQKLIN